jgi:hypothetical protein
MNLSPMLNQIQTHLSLRKEIRVNKFYLFLGLLPQIEFTINLKPGVKKKIQIFNGETTEDVLEKIQRECSKNKM